MFLKKQIIKSTLTIKKQSGFLLPLLMVIIVSASGIALVLLEQATSPSLSMTSSAIATKTNIVAKTGAELAAYRILFASSSPITERQESDAQCASMNISSALSTSGFEACSLSVSCECRYDNNAICDSTNNNNYNNSLGIRGSVYQLNSEARCGEGFATAYAEYNLIKKRP